MSPKNRRRKEEFDFGWLPYHARSPLIRSRVALKLRCHCHRQALAERNRPFARDCLRGSSAVSHALLPLKYDGIHLNDARHRKIPWHLSRRIRIYGEQTNPVKRRAMRQSRALATARITIPELYRSLKSQGILPLRVRHLYWPNEFRKLDIPTKFPKSRVYIKLPDSYRKGVSQSIFPLWEKIAGLRGPIILLLNGTCCSLESSRRRPGDHSSTRGV